MYAARADRVAGGQRIRICAVVGDAAGSHRHRLVAVVAQAITLAGLFISHANKPAAIAAAVAEAPAVRDIHHIADDAERGRAHFGPMNQTPIPRHSRPPASPC